MRARRPRGGDRARTRRALAARAGAALLACLSAGDAPATITHRPGKDSQLYRAYLDYALVDDERALERAIALQGETSFLVLEQALLAARRGDQARMIERAERAIQLDSDNAEAHELLARVHFRLADDGLDAAASRAKAAEHAEALVRLRRADPQVFERLAALHGQAAREAESAQDDAAAVARRAKQRQVLETWAERSRQDEPWRRLAEMAREVGDVGLEVRALREAAKRAPADLALVQELAELLRRLGRCEQALPLLESAAAQPSLDVYAAIGINVNLGDCAMALGRLGLAEQALGRALEHDPTNLIAAREKASALWEQGDRKAALALLDAAGEKLTRRVSTLEARAAWDLEHGLHQDALRHAEQALAEAKELGAPPVSMADLHVLLGSVQLEMGDAAASEQSARRALDLEPGDDDAAFLLAEAAWERGSRDAAVESLDAFRRRAGAAVPLLLRRARWDAAHGRRDEASAGALAALEAGLGSGRVAARGFELLSREVAGILLSVGRAGEAETVLRKALGRTPDRPELLLDLADALVAQGRAEEAVALVDRLPTPDAYDHERRARWHVEHRLVDAAVTEALAAHAAAVAAGAQRSELARFETLVGEAYLAAAQPALAAEWLERATSDAERQPRQRLLLEVRALDDAGQDAAALAAVGAALEQHPTDAALELARARLLLETGRAREAIQATARLVADRPRSALVRRQVALTLQQGGEPQEARRIADSGLRDFPRDMLTWLLSATLHDQQGRLEAAEADLRRAMELFPESPTPLNALGYMLAQRAVRLDEAVALLRRAVEISPHEAAYLDSLGWALLQHGKLAEAERHLEAAVARDRDPVVVMHLGTLRERQGRSADALELYREALRFGLEEEEERVRAAVERLGSPRR